jgi:hypothetical protein
MKPTILFGKRRLRDMLTHYMRQGILNEINGLGGESRHYLELRGAQPRASAKLKVENILSKPQKAFNIKRLQVRAPPLLSA